MDVGLPRRSLTGVLGQPPEIYLWVAAGHRGDPWRREIEFVKLSIVVQRRAVQQSPQDCYHLDGAGIARRAGQGLAGQIAGDDFDGQPPIQQPIEGGDLPGQLRRPHLATARDRQ